MSGWHNLSSYCFNLLKLHSFFRLVRMATLDTSFLRISLRKLFLTAPVVNQQFSLNVPIFDEESISNRLTSRYSEVHYTFAVKGFCALLSAFKISSGTQLHSCTDLSTLCRDKSHSYLPLPQIVCLQSPRFWETRDQRFPGSLSLSLAP